MQNVSVRSLRLPRTDSVDSAYSRVRFRKLNLNQSSVGDRSTSKYRNDSIDKIMKKVTSRNVGEE